MKGYLKHFTEKVNVMVSRDLRSLINPFLGMTDTYLIFETTGGLSDLLLKGWTVREGLRQSADLLQDFSYCPEVFPEVRLSCFS